MLSTWGVTMFTFIGDHVAILQPCVLCLHNSWLLSDNLYGISATSFKVSPKYRENGSECKLYVLEEDGDTLLCLMFIITL